MIHYHVIGWENGQDLVRWLAGRHALVSLPVANYLDLVAPVVQSFVIDNGAFSAWRKGEAYDFDGYLEVCYHWHRHPAFDWALIPDKIDGSEAENDDLVRAWPDDIRGVPVWHLHESFGRLKRLAAAFEYVALGSSGAWSHPGSRAWWRRMSEAMDALCDDQGRPPCRLHGLRMMRPEIVEKLPLSSADSTNASRSARDAPNKAKAGKAVIGLHDKRIRAEILALRAEAYQSAATWQRVDQATLPLFETNGSL